MLYPETSSYHERPPTTNNVAYHYLHRLHLSNSNSVSCLAKFSAAAIQNSYQILDDCWDGCDLAMVGPERYSGEELHPIINIFTASNSKYLLPKHTDPEMAHSELLMLFWRMSERWKQDSDHRLLPRHVRTSQRLAALLHRFTQTPTPSPKA